MIAFFIFALVAVSQAVEVDRPENMELPAHIQALITNHINHVLETTQKPHGHTTVLTGHVPQVGEGNGNGNGKGKAAAAVPHLDLLPPHVERPKVVPQVINHQATGTWQHSAVAGHNKVVMPPVPQIVVSVPGQPTLNIGDKVNKLHQHVNNVMHLAETHIPSAINQAIHEREKLQAEKEKQKQKEKHQVTTSTSAPGHQRLRLLSNEVEIPELLEKQRDLKKLGKCNFECPQQSLPICATNGNCVVEFSGQCELSEWNCFNTKNVFHQVHDDECRNMIKCYDRDME
ncbi:uncharacterized protein LOC117787525 [Drosophila innubila]|uniref:uncharacterized protein LOC117787525 n=1 Tax=Drosophila innubila TaxID=198719 RepID=UPI00148BCC18|nr:uncharacterized protein LOC117787525 [Drosophila innubila]